MYESRPTKSRCHRHSTDDTFELCPWCEIESMLECPDCGPVKNNCEGPAIEHYIGTESEQGRNPRDIDLYFAVCPDCNAESESYRTATAMKHLCDWVVSQ